MKVNHKILFTVIVVTHLIALCACSSIYYFPDIDDFTGEWYGKQLKALEEPSIYRQSNNKNLKIFRFTWLRTFHKPIAIRIIIKQDNSGILYAKIASGAGGYVPGKLEKSIEKKLDNSDVTDFLTMIEKESFWNIPTVEETDEYGLDGAQWIVEGLLNGNYHVVDWWSPEKGNVRNIGLYFLNISGLEVNEIY